MVLFCKFGVLENYIPPGGFRRYEYIDIIHIEDAPAWLAPYRGVADPTRERKAGTYSIACLTQKGKDNLYENQKNHRYAVGSDNFGQL